MGDQPERLGTLPGRVGSPKGSQKISLEHSLDMYFKNPTKRGGGGRLWWLWSPWLPSKSAVGSLLLIESCNCYRLTHFFAFFFLEKTELFLELFGNSLVRPQASEYLQQKSSEFIRYMYHVVILVLFCRMFSTFKIPFENEMKRILRDPGGYSKKFYTGRLRPEVQPLTLLYTIFSEKAPLSYTFYWKKAPLSHTFL